MTFIEAIEYLKNNPEGKIRRPDFNQTSCIKIDAKLELAITDSTGFRFGRPDLRIDDCLASDWEIYQETFDFATAIQKLKEGKKIGRLSKQGYWYINENGGFVSDENEVIDFIGILAVFATDWVEYTD